MEVVALAFGDLRSIAGGLTIRAHNKQHRKNNTKMLLPMLLAKTKDHLPTSSTLSLSLFFYLDDLRTRLLNSASDAHGPASLWALSG